MTKTDKNTFIIQEVDSSNNYAKQLITAGKADHGTVVLAHFQNAGKGHAENQWESEPGKNMLASFILFPKFLRADKQFYLSKIISLALVDFLNDEMVSASVKWPNDIYIENKKLAGILIENSVSGSYIHSSVIGVGLNLNQVRFSEQLPNPVSLKQITQKNYSPETVVEQLKGKLWSWYRKLEDGQQDFIDSAYLQNLYRREKWGRFKKGDDFFEARIKGIGEYGQLVLGMRNGTERVFQFKEVEFIL
jgi:BirA family biotin operon repressor/biotin-[acetyl-CoA-carboxylase] ligase